MRPIWAEVSGGALRHNLSGFRRRLPRTNAPAICAVIKANAYGHGLVECARALGRERVGWFAVTSVEEARALRAAGMRQRVLVLGAYDRTDAAEMVRLGLTATIWEAAQVRLVAQAAARGKAPLPVHLKIDTGMGRLGAAGAEASRLAAAIAARPQLRLEAVYSHLRSADDDLEATRAQWRAFGAVRRALGAGAPRHWHIANSAALRRFPASRGGAEAMVRLGIGLYGYGARGLKPALSWKTRIIAMQELARGRRVGYGGEFVARRRSRIAVVAAGYADGYARRLWPAGGYVLVRGRRAPLAGRISMDLTSIDVTDIPGARVGDVAILLGRQGREAISADRLAAWCGTIAYEILCAIATRVPRRWV